MQATLTCNSNLNETRWKENEYNKPVAAKAQAGKGGEKITLDKASLALKLNFGLVILNKKIILLWDRKVDPEQTMQVQYRV